MIHTPTPLLAISVVINQGFQQVEDAELVGIEPTTRISIGLSVYPNPTYGVLNISTDLSSIGIDQLDFRIMDMHGRVVKEGSIQSGMDRINLQELAAASYMIELFDQQHIHEHFRVLKL